MNLRNSKLNSEKGASLLELVLVIVIVGIISAFISGIMFFGVNLYNKLIDQTEAVQLSRNSFQMITRDVRSIMARDSIFVASSDSIKFDDVDDNMISYKISNGQIFRNSDLLQNSVSSLQFSYIDGSGNALAVPVSDVSAISLISINLITSVSGQSFNLTTQIQPRNF